MKCIYHEEFDQAAEGLDEGSDVDLLFSLKGSTLYQARTSHEYYLCILAMFTMSRKYVKHVNWPRLEVLSLRVCKSETRTKSAVKLWFSDDIVIKLATSLTMWYIWDLTHLS